MSDLIKPVPTKLECYDDNGRGFFALLLIHRDDIVSGTEHHERPATKDDADKFMKDRANLPASAD